MRIRKRHHGVSPLPVAGNGLLDRRALLGGGVALAGAVGTSLTSAAAEPLTNGPWSLAPGVPVPPYGQPRRNSKRRWCAP
jgi:sulfane dehydrogenase subunit SoxC